MLGKGIRVAKDRQGIRLWISSPMRQSGYVAVKAGDCASALRMARSDLPDLILLDPHLPCGRREFVLESLR